MDWRRVVKHYLTTWFSLDLVSSIPFEDISSGNMMDLQAAKLLKLGKLARMMKMMSPGAWDAADFSTTMEDLMHNKAMQQLSRRGSVIVKMLLLCHWLACGLKMVDTGYLSTYQDVSLTVVREYTAAIYWSMTTLTTVGFGDMIPTSDAERLYTTFAMVLGGAFYGYVVGSITSMVSNNDLNASAYYDRMDLIHAWLNHHKLPIHKKRMVRRYFKAYLTEKSALSEADIWHDLSPELQKEIGEYLVHENVKYNPLFDGMTMGCIVRLQSILRRVTMHVGAEVTLAGEQGTAMYILIEGKVKKTEVEEICKDAKGEIEVKRRETTLGPGESFGEEILLGIMEGYEYTTNVTEKAKFEMLLEDEFMGVFAAMPHVLDRMRQNAYELHPTWVAHTENESAPSNAGSGSPLHASSWSKGHKDSAREMRL